MKKAIAVNNKKLCIKVSVTLMNSFVYSNCYYQLQFSTTVQCFVLQKKSEQNYSSLHYPEFPEHITDHIKESVYESVTTTINLL